MMVFQVTNEEMTIGTIQLLAVASSSLFKIGDTQSIQLFSAFDTPPESLIIGPFAAITPGAK